MHFAAICAIFSSSQNKPVKSARILKDIRLSVLASWSHCQFLIMLKVKNSTRGAHHDAAVAK